MLEDGKIDKMPEVGQKLGRYLNCKEYYEILLLDMLRAGDIGEVEYSKIISQSEAAYKQFRIDLASDKKLHV